MLKYFVLLGIILLSLNLVNAGYCYQEQTNAANSSTDGNCGLNYYGTYSQNSTWVSTIDRNWGTYSSSYYNALNITYYKPLNESFNTSLWQVKDGLGTANLSIPNACFNRDPITFGILSNGTCFSGETKIRTILNEKEIKDIKVGDYVLSYNEDFKLNTYSKVIETFYHKKEETSSYLLINNNLKVTSNHQMYINGKWIEVGNSNIGDYFINYLGNKIIINSIKQINNSIETYNLEVDNTHNYYANDLLAHNKPQYLKWVCWNGTRMLDMRYASGGFTYNAYEEGMVWNVTNVPTYNCNFGSICDCRNNSIFSNGTTVGNTYFTQTGTIILKNYTLIGNISVSAGCNIYGDANSNIFVN